MKVEIYKKTKRDFKLKPNLEDYEKTYKKFDWKEGEKELEWFPGRKLNAAYEAIDKHLKTFRKNKVALYWENEAGEKKEYSFWQLSALSNKVANLLKKLGIQKGDRVFIFLPRVPELYYSFLGILKTGAIAGTLFQAFGPSGLYDRLFISGARFLITNRELSERVYKVKKRLPHLEKIIIVDDKPRHSFEIDFQKEMEKASDKFKIAEMDKDDYAFELFTSGCCHSDTLIQLSNGEIKRIEEIIEGNKKDPSLINFTPNPFRQTRDKISTLHKYHFSGDLYEITTSSAKGKFTPNHSFFTLDKEGKITEKEAQELDLGEYIFVASKINIKGKKQLLPPLSRRTEYKNSGQFQTSNIPRIPKYLTPNFAQILGYLAGHGHLDQRSIIFTDKDKQTLKHYQKLIKKELRLKSLIRKINRQRLLINSVLFRDYIRENFNQLISKSSERKIASLIQRADNKTVAGFLRGLFDAKGCVGGLFIKISVTSPELARVSQILLKRFGILSYIHSGLNLGGRFGGKRIKETFVYNLTISERRSLRRFNKEIGFSVPSKKFKFKLFLKNLEKRRTLESERFPLVYPLKRLHSVVPIPEKLMKDLRKTLYSGNYLIGKSILRKIIQFVVKKMKEIPYLTEKSWRNTPKIKLKKALINKSDTLKILYEIYSTLKKLANLQEVMLEKIKDIKIVKNDSQYVYDLTALKNHTYIANGFIVHNTTGKPKGVVHCHYAILQEHLTSKWVLDIHDEDILWCTADPGWVTGIGYTILGVWSIGASEVVYDGRFDPARWYEILEKYKVTVWYTAPTAIRMLEKAGEDLVKKYDLSNLRYLASVGEPLNPEPIRWGLKVFGLPFHDNWWQTETGGICIGNYPSLDIKLGSMGKPIPGVVAEIVNDKGKVLGPNQEGNLALRPGWPGMMRTIWRRPKKYKSYFVGKWYITGDLAYKDKDGYFWFIGRADDVIKTAGERVGPFEVESALVDTGKVVEAGVIGKPDPERGEIIKAFCVLKEGVEPSEKLKKELSFYVKKHLAGHAYPREIEFVDKLPKTRSGKIMRRVLKAKELGLPVGDISTLEEY